MEQLVIVIVIAAIGFIKWVMEKSAEQRARRETEEGMDRLERSQPPVPPRHLPQPIDSFPRPDIAARRLREALGLPEEEFEMPAPRKPPAPQPPAFHVDEIKVVPVADLERRIVESQKPRPFPKYEPPAPLPALRKDRAQAAPTGLEELLRSRDGLRKAILVQEILGTPKGLVF